MRTRGFCIKACVDLSALREGQKIQAQVVKIGFESDVFVGDSLLAMYAKCGSFEVACQLFDEMSERDVVSWSSIICAYAQSGLVFEVLILFHQMQLADVSPDAVTVGDVLQACASLAALQQGKKIHGYVIKSGLESDVSVGSALINMYAKCGSLEIACQLFDKMGTKNVVSWSAMISGYGMHGHGEHAVAVFAQMQQTDVKPDHIAFLSVLSACSHAGLVDEGRKYFDCMIREHGVMPWLDHFACMVDLLGRAGNLDEAEDFIKKMPVEPNIGVWLSLLGACRVHRNIEIGERTAEQLLAIDSANVECYMLLSNIYADAGRWDDVTKVRKAMKERGLKKIPGCSLIEINNMIHTFFVGDSTPSIRENLCNAGHLDRADEGGRVCT